MSLRKKSTMTPKRISANRANGRRSHGPATPEGRERIRAAHTRHGSYSQAKAVALTCLGEDPAELERLRDDLQGDVQLAGALEKQLREHLVEVFWRWKRAGRGQEGFALRLAPTHPNALLMRRTQDSYFRGVRRVTSLLLKLKRQAREE